MSKEKQILQLRCKGYSQRKIAETLQISRNTVAKVFNAMASNAVSEDTLEDLSDEELHRKLFPEDLHTPGVTLKLLWEEYGFDCRVSKKPPYMYSQFCKLYQDYVDRHRLTMHIQHKPGDKLMVDWTGTPLPLFDKLTGNACKVYLFVATLPFSMYGTHKLALP